ncbi:MAG: hypothetical protein OXI77_06170 [Chloroflexota bacterium]|nr:hypothetical protein [Chloroflexota bacterium]MDE2909795.1 hypothetical protein [Chloroflexota bacterium]
MSDDSLQQTRIAHLEQTVQHLRERLAALEAVQPHMATKADAIRSSWLPHIRISIGRGKRKHESGPSWISNDANLLLAIIAAGIIGVFVGSGFSHVIKTLAMLLAQ